jgi:hypothetical protein
MYREHELDSLLSSIARGSVPTMVRDDLGQERNCTNAARAHKETAVATRHNQPDLEARLRLIEIRLAHMNDSLAYLEASQKYTEVLPPVSGHTITLYVYVSSAHTIIQTIF